VKSSKVKFIAMTAVALVLAGGGVSVLAWKLTHCRYTLIWQELPGRYEVVTLSDVMGDSVTETTLMLDVAEPDESGSRMVTVEFERLVMRSDDREFDSEHPTSIGMVARPPSSWHDRVAAAWERLDALTVTYLCYEDIVSGPQYLRAEIVGLPSDRHERASVEGTLHGLRCESMTSRALGWNTELLPDHSVEVGDTWRRTLEVHDRLPFQIDVPVERRFLLFNRIDIVETGIVQAFREEVALTCQLFAVENSPHGKVAVVRYAGKLRTGADSCWNAEGDEGSLDVQLTGEFRLEIETGLLLYYSSDTIGSLDMGIAGMAPAIATIHRELTKTRME
jgi:hypothetical protein